MKHMNEQAFVQAVPVKMTRQERLIRLAMLVKDHHGSIFLFHNLEYVHPSQLHQVATGVPDTVFAIASSDPVFNQEGLLPGSNLPEFMRFFEISQHQLHEFSCDCGGHITNDAMSRRIEYLAR